MRRNETVVVDDVGIVNVVVGLKRLEDLHHVAIEETIVFRSVADCAPIGNTFVVWLEKRLPVKQAVVDGPLQGKLCEASAQQSILAA